jgi:hypothetical protein
MQAMLQGEIQYSFQMHNIVSTFGLLVFQVENL